MHYLGSKQELFRRVIDAAPVPEVSGAPEQAIEQILATLADRLANEPVASLAILRSMLTNTEAASVISEGMTRYQAQIAQTIPVPAPIAIALSDGSERDRRQSELIQARSSSAGLGEDG
jgi:hypothetical protein